MVCRFTLFVGAILGVVSSALSQNFHPTDAELLAAAELGYRNAKAPDDGVIFDDSYHNVKDCVQQPVTSVKLISPLLAAYEDGLKAWKAFAKMPSAEDLRRRNGTAYFIVLYLAVDKEDEAHLALSQGDELFKPVEEVPAKCTDVEFCYGQVIWSCYAGALFAIDTKGAVTSRKPASLLVRRTSPVVSDEQSFIVRWSPWSAD